MKTLVYFLLTCFISCAALMAALGAKHPVLLYAVGFGVWVPFFWGWNRRAKKVADRKTGERLFQDYMRTQLRNSRR